MSDLRVLQMEKVSYVLFSKYLTISPIGSTKEYSDLSHAVLFFNHLNFYGRHFESYRACMTGNSFMLMVCSRVMS
jgi:hypothetical protein